MTGRRSDAERNYRRILTVAEAEIAELGAAASIERVARTAGLGSATVRRHFPTRQALLEAVFAERAQALQARAAELTGESDSRAALLAWLRDFTDYAVSARGFADVLAYEPPAEAGGEAGEAAPSSCGTMLEAALAPLLARAQREGAARPEASCHDLVTAVAGITLATEHHRDPAAQAARLLDLFVTGLSPRG
ncbi:MULTISPECIES: TetR/AcrR family transcriptional regulator [Streptomyces]|uniref:TetR family transcriptional regulator n=1 Tax=Streptomyces wadayamensis TaxID=141454 RepID=A0ABR4S2L0_9ACTN|nr:MULTISPECIES: TetR/AcrR family transcriptional regulator [Streptomyces]KDR59868.1 TetR family transcriptional regulator [Streptomyces wadayamensis]QXQ27305.1 TetR/AcrR family transcriptional regulator [Streptomyces albidoflavus]QXQ33232.1 TetR/AcrR family transcriptional regulator [Streptomyces albidoflavus]WJK66355.1 TetR/AcrR family transcriptional regulator [Streptomyces albidoflavus]WSD55546.1 TetR/AcrR family transcriptional regulator [Streptomyces albidoflavus]